MWQITYGFMARYLKTFRALTTSSRVFTGLPRILSLPPRNDDTAAQHIDHDRDGDEEHGCLAPPTRETRIHDWS
jgi:hypothetical protein